MVPERREQGALDSLRVPARAFEGATGLVFAVDPPGPERVGVFSAGEDDVVEVRQRRVEPADGVGPDRPVEHDQLVVDGIDGGEDGLRRPPVPERSGLGQGIGVDAPVSDPAVVAAVGSSDGHERSTTHQGPPSV